MLITRHRTIYGRLRAHGSQVAETMARFSENPSSSSPDASRYANKAVITHFSRKTRFEIHEEMRLLMDSADDGEGRMRRPIEKKRGQWWQEALRQADKAPPPDIQNVEAYRRYVEIDAFRLQKIVSTLQVRHVLGMDGNVGRDEIEAAVTSLPTSHDVFKGVDSFGVRSLVMEDDDRFLIEGDVIEIIGDYPEALIASLPGRHLDELLDIPAIRGSGIRILQAEQAKTLLIHTDAHDEDNTVSTVAGQ